MVDAGIVGFGVPGGDYPTANGASHAEHYWTGGSGSEAAAGDGDFVLAELAFLRLVVEDQRKRLAAARDCYASLELDYQRQKRLNLALADKLAICAELLGKRAEKATAQGAYADCVREIDCCKAVLIGHANADYWRDAESMFTVLDDLRRIFAEKQA